MLGLGKPAPIGTAKAKRDGAERSDAPDSQTSGGASALDLATRADGFACLISDRSGNVRTASGDVRGLTGGTLTEATVIGHPLLDLMSQIELSGMDGEPVARGDGMEEKIRQIAFGGQERRATCSPQHSKRGWAS